MDNFVLLVVPELSSIPEPAYEKIYKEDPTQGISDWLLPFTVNLEDLEYMCSHFPLKGWTQIRKGALQKWRYQNESTVFILTSVNTVKRSIPRTEEIGDMKTVEHKSESRINHQFAAVVQDLTIQWMLPVKPKLHSRRREEFYASFQSRRRSQKVFIWTIYENVANIVKNYHGIIGQLYLID